MKITGAIFDLDGTLLDSMFIWDTIGENYLRSLGIEPRENLNETFKKMSLYQAACYYQSAYGVTLSTDEIMAGVNEQIEHLYADIVLAKAGVPLFLEKLKAKGVKMCIATATDRHLVEAALKRNQLRHYFADIFTCTMVGHGKDEPDIYDVALHFLQTDKGGTLVFEDALYAIKTAKRAGFTVAAIADRSAVEVDEIKQLADYYIEDFEKAECILQ